MLSELNPILFEYLTNDSRLLSLVDAEKLYSEEEVWKDIPEYLGLYSVSNLGRVKSHDRVVQRSDGVASNRKGKILQPGIRGGIDGRYLIVVLTDTEGKKKTHYVHRLVLSTFEGITKETVGHLNQIPFDNRLLNLKNQSYDEQHLERSGIFKPKISKRRKRPVQYIITGEGLCCSVINRAKFREEIFYIGEGPLNSLCTGKSNRSSLYKTSAYPQDYLDPIKELLNKN